MFLRLLTTACLLCWLGAPSLTTGQRTAAGSVNLQPVSTTEDVYLDKTYYQGEGQTVGEIEVEDAENDQLDADNMFSDDLPEDMPTADEVKTLLDRGRIIGDSTYLAEYNPYVAYEVSDVLTSWRCCPRRQNYACRSYYRSMPCFYHYVNGVRERCCTVWPQNIRYAYCNCSKCAVLTPYCASVGRCLRRYRSTTVWAVCFKPDQAWTFRRLIRKVPTSCYCKTHC